MTEPINLTQLRHKALHGYGLGTGPYGEALPTWPKFAPSDVLALIDVAEAAMVLANETKFLSPAAYDRLRESLSRFTTSQPPK